MEQSKSARRHHRRKAAFQAATCAVACERLHPLPRATPKHAEKQYGIKNAQAGSTLLVPCVHCKTCCEMVVEDDALKHALGIYRPGQSRMTVHGVMHTDPRGFIFVSSFKGKVSAVRPQDKDGVLIEVRLYDAAASFPITDAAARVFLNSEKHLRLTMPDSHTCVVSFVLHPGEETHPLVSIGSSCKDKCAKPCLFHELRLPEFIETRQ